MFITDPHYDALLAREHDRRVRAEVAAERVHGRSTVRRRCFAALLRRAADRLDAGSPAPKPAIQC